MAASRHSRSRRSSHHASEGEHEAGMERWLLTYADMLTLLFALFMLLFAMSSPDSGKFNQLKTSLQEAFSGKILPGGTSILERGGSDAPQHVTQSAAVPSQTASAAKSDASIAAATAQTQAEAARIVQQNIDFTKLKHEIDQAAAHAGLSGSLQTTIERRGLVVRLLTDKIAFDSGSAALKPEVEPLLKTVTGLIVAKSGHDRIAVEGYTDSVRLRRHAHYPTNWELSGARAASVTRWLIRSGMHPGRLSASGYSYLHPIANNATASGRAENRRVEIVVVRPGLEGS